MSAKSTKSRPKRKAPNLPPKPYRDFPLTPQSGGYWMKKIKGKLYYFGRWGRKVNGKMERLPGDGWKDALADYQARREDLYAGRKHRPKSGDSLTLANLCNCFLTAKKRAREAGEIKPRTFAEYQSTTDLIVARFGTGRLVDDIAADDFESLRAEMATRWGPVRLRNEIQRVRTVFKYAYDNGLLDRPIRFGSEFKKPSAGILRIHRADQNAEHGKKFLEADELRKLIDAAPVETLAMILLGLNCGFGNSDCAELPASVVNLDKGWIDYPRPKTGIERRCPLWPETIEALRDYLKTRVSPREEEAQRCFFTTSRGSKWLPNTIGTRTRDLMKREGVHRPRIGFYTFRHVFETVASGARDQVAVDAIMGHADSSMAANYRQGIKDERLQAVVDHVRGWLFNSEEGESKTDVTSDLTSDSGERRTLRVVG